MLLLLIKILVAHMLSKEASTSPTHTLGILANHQDDTNKGKLMTQKFGLTPTTTSDTVLFQDITILDEAMQAVPHQDVFVEHGKIQWVEPHAQSHLRTTVSDRARVIGGAHHVLLPGFYNMHTHVPMVLLRGYAENLPLHEWLNDAVWPFEEHIDDEAMYWGTMLALAEMIQAGTVSFSDMYFLTHARLRAIKESGIKVNISDGGTMTLDDVAYESLPVKAVNDYLLQELHGQGDGKIRMDFCIHGEYTTCQSMIERVRDEALAHQAGIHLHLAETQREVEECKARHQGLTPTEWLAKLGVFKAPTTAAHCVWTKGDLDILKEYDVSPVINPASNMKLASGFAPVGEMLAKSLNVCIGTDGVASNNAHDILRELYLFATIYKGSSLDPTVVTPAQALAALTVNGAKAQGRPDCGAIKAGNHADLAMMNLENPAMTPCFDLATNLVFSANSRDVVLTMVDGKVLYEQGNWTTIDVERARFEVNRISTNIARKAQAAH